MAPKYFDIDGVERSEAWAQETYGIVFLDAGWGEKFALTEVHETDGVASVQVNVFNAAGGPQYGQPVAQSWPTLEGPATEQLDLCMGSISCWSDYCMHVYTSAEGVAGFPFGGGAVIKDGRGPLSFWVLSPTLKSDGLARVGWDGGTNHRGMLHLVFRIWSEGVDPPPPSETTEQTQRCLDKAEAIADDLASSAVAGERIAAASFYVQIAEEASWR